MSTEDPKRQTDSPKELSTTQRINNNRLMLDLRQQIQWQNDVILGLKAERDQLTKELASRLVYVEAQLRREQKHIETILQEKDQLIEFQTLQIESLKRMLSKCSCYNYRGGHQVIHSGKKTKGISKRYSVALDEYMKDHDISRASPVIVRADSEYDIKDKFFELPDYFIPSRTLSLPELRFLDGPDYENIDWVSKQMRHYAATSMNRRYQRSNEQRMSDTLPIPCWNSSDCDSEHSDSLDSGISSPSIQSRSKHLEDAIHSPIPGGYYEFPFEANSTIGPKPTGYSQSRSKTMTTSQAYHKFGIAGAMRSSSMDKTLLPIKEVHDSTYKAVPMSQCKRSSSIGDLIQRTFSSSQLEKISYDPDFGNQQRGFGGIKPKDRAYSLNESILAGNRDQKKCSQFFSSANRNFGTNHRSVTKPRDIKFRKLFKFRRRSETTSPETMNNNYMTV